MRGARREIRNCRHIENHNSCEWRQAPGIPGAYRDRYLDRVTINTDPCKVALGIIRGPRGEVTYTYLYPLSLPPPLGLSSSSRRSDTTKVIISDTRKIPVLLLIIAKRPFVPAILQEDLCSHRCRLKIVRTNTREGMCKRRKR